MAGWGLYQSLTPSLPQLVKFHCMNEGLIIDCNSSDAAMEKKKKSARKFSKQHYPGVKPAYFFQFFSVGVSVHRQCNRYNERHYLLGTGLPRKILNALPT